MLYGGKRFSAVCTAQRIVTVCCDKCQGEFYYELIRQGEGAASAPYFIGQYSARKRAERRAAKHADRRIARESELVACPRCNWVNNALIRGYRNARFKSFSIIAIIAALLAWIIVFIAMCGKDSQFEAPRYPCQTGAITGVVGGVICGGIVLLLRSWLRRRINPNRMFPAAPIAPPGTPKAWIVDELASRFSEPAERLEPDIGSTKFPDWLLFHAGHLIIPHVCCQCLAPAVTRYRRLFTVTDDTDTLEAPLCAACFSRLRWKWWKSSAVIVAGVAVISWIIYVFAQWAKVDYGLYTALFAFWGLAFGLAIIPNLITKPYRLRAVDRGRSVFRIKFRSAPFTELVRRASIEDEKATFLE